MVYYLNVKSEVKGGESGEDVFRLLSFSGHEEMSRLFRFILGLESKRHDITPDEIIGKPITFSVQDDQGKPRYFNGYVSRFVAGGGETGWRRYEAEVVPWLWFLTQTSDCRFFSKKKVPDILQDIFKDVAVPHPLNDSNLNAGTYREWEYCVQYHETDFNFVSRLMEQEGIFYYFEHEQGKHTLVLGDKTDHYRQDLPTLRYEYSMGSEPRTPESKSIVRWGHEYQFIPGQFAQTDYEFIKLYAGSEITPAKRLLEKTPTAGKPKTIIPKTHEVFQYPGEYKTADEARTLTKRYLEQLETAYDTASGTTYYERLGPGARFKLEHVPIVKGQKHPASDLEDKNYVVISLDHSASEPYGDYEGETYTSNFTCMPADVPFRPARTTAKPKVHGVQTAVVVGPEKQEIDVDEHGRVCAQFFWDRYNTRLQSGADADQKKKQAEPVRIRVGQIMAGKNWGAMFIPRIGQEVIVSFLEGDPDRPLITGVVYNGEQTPHYDPKKFPTRSYIKTNSSLGGKGYNELRFEDKAGKEQVFIHAQRNMDVRTGANSMESVGGDRHLIVGGEKDGVKNGFQFERVYVDKYTTVHRNQVEQVGGDMGLKVGGIDGPGHQNIIIQGTKKELIEKESHLHVKANRCEKVDVDQSLTVGNNQQEKVGMKHALDAGQEIHLKAGMKVVIEAGMQLTIKGPGGFVDIGPAGVTIQGTLVNINSGGAAGAGSGSSPTAPVDPPDLDPPSPTPADSDTTGQKSTPF